jgi:hypothetical protein
LLHQSYLPTMPVATTPDITGAIGSGGEDDRICMNKSSYSQLYISSTISYLCTGCRQKCPSTNVTAILNHAALHPWMPLCEICKDVFFADTRQENV